MIPPFDAIGNLPAGVHWTNWREFAARFGWNARRGKLLVGLKRAIDSLRMAGCREVYIDGSFVTAKDLPGDFDACWSVKGVDPNLLDPVLLTFDNHRAAQKAKYGGEMFPAELPEGASGLRFLDFFQVDKSTGRPKGIIGMRIRRRRP